MAISDRRTFLKTGVAALGGAMAMSSRRPAFADGGRKPNVLFVFSDEHRAISTGCYGDTQVRTPNIDAFGREGARLDTCIASTPVCCPYRATLMTGMLGHENGVVTNEIPLNPQWQGATLGGTFKRAGYACGYIGKWHLGATQLAPGAGRFGFDDCWAVAANPHDYADMHYHDGPGKAVIGPGHFAPTLQTDQAIDFIEKNKEKPWCLALSWGPPHPPFVPPLGFGGQTGLKVRSNVPAGKAADYAFKNQSKYYGLIESLDAEFGRLIAKLDALKLSEDTIVVYTSDHGDMLGSQGLIAKRWPYDESSRVPFIIRWPKHIAASSIAMPLGTEDIFPTLAGLADLTAPAGIHGNDYSALIAGKQKARAREHVFMTMQHGYVPWPGWRGVRTAQYLYARTESAPWFLYDMKSDPYQQNNLLKDKAGLAGEMDALTLDSMKKLGETWRGGPHDAGDAETFKLGAAKRQDLGGEWPMK